MRRSPAGEVRYPPLGIKHDDSEYKIVTISLGCTTLVLSQAGDATQVIADAALYQAKDAGRNRVESLSILNKIEPVGNFVPGPYLFGVISVSIDSSFGAFPGVEVG